MDEVLIANKAFSENDIRLAMESGLGKLIGRTPVSASEKLASAWGAIKAGNQD